MWNFYSHKTVSRQPNSTLNHGCINSISVRSLGSKCWLRKWYLWRWAKPRCTLHRTVIHCTTTVAIVTMVFSSVLWHLCDSKEFQHVKFNTWFPKVLLLGLGLGLTWRPFKAKRKIVVSYNCNSVSLLRNPTPKGLLNKYNLFFTVLFYRVRN